ncbi:MAG: flippase-like domain-containing protein, partial [Acidobacteria bacterium]|nr:flippase-like domain-containing protein [Acidobacteriota bacterium]
YLIRALRWRRLLAPVAESSVRNLLAATSVGFGAIFVVGRSGEVLRPTFLSAVDPRVRPAASFVTIGVERVFDMAAVVLVFAVNLIWFRAPGGDPAAYARVRQAGFFLLGAFAVGIAALVVFRAHAATVIAWLERKSGGEPTRAKRAARFLTGILDQLRLALGVLVDARALAVTVGWTALLWAVIAFADFLVLRAFNLPFGMDETVFVLGWALVGSLVPTPGGAAGAFHVATARGLSFLGVADAKATAVSIVLHLVLFGPAFFLGLYFMLRSDVKLSRLRGAAREQGDAGEEAIKRAGFVREEKAGATVAR